MQRVPATEKQGRRHSSTVTLIAVPEVEAPTVAIDRRDVQVTTFRASIFRVLRPGGVLQFADIANGRPVPIEAMRDVELWTG